ncbi:MAG: hypothetical protein QUV05_13050, partial [Phycisphaerae bacterium]|nr:hypothetical protein [Phycisphaerae bacterium]
RLTADKLWCMFVDVASKKGPQLVCDDRLIDDVINQAARTNAGPSWHRLKSSIVVYGSQQKELRPLFRLFPPANFPVVISQKRVSCETGADLAAWIKGLSLDYGFIHDCHWFAHEAMHQASCGTGDCGTLP